MKEIRSNEFYNNKINLIIIIFIIAACISSLFRMVFFMLIHFNSEKKNLESQIMMKDSVNVVVFPYGNYQIISSSRKNTEAVFKLNLQLQSKKNSSSIDDINFEEKLNINNIYEDDSYGTGSEDKTVKLMRYDSSFLRNDKKKDKNIFSN